MSNMNKLFLTSSAYMVMDDLLSKFDKPVKGLRLMFLNTASEVEKGDKKWLQDDRDSLVKAGFDVFDYTLTNKSEEEVVKVIEDIDVLFVAGGNTFYLLEQARKCGFEKVVKGLMERGVVYIGSSAGSLLAGPDIEPIRHLDDPSKSEGLESFEAFGLTDVIVFPHWGSDGFRDKYLKLVESVYGVGKKIILLTDQQYVMVEGESYQIVDVG